MNILSFIAVMAFLVSNTDDPTELSVRQKEACSQYYAYEIMDDYSQNEDAIDNEDVFDNCDDVDGVTALPPGVFFSNPQQDVMSGGEANDLEKSGALALVVYDFPNLADHDVDSQSVCTIDVNDFTGFIPETEGRGEPGAFSYITSNTSFNLPETGSDIAVVYPHPELFECERKNSLYPVAEWGNDQCHMAYDPSSENCSVQGRGEMAGLLKTAGVMNHLIYEAKFNYQVPSHTLDMNGCMTKVWAKEPLQAPPVFDTEIQSASCVPNTSWLRYVKRFKSGFLLNRSDRALIKNDEPFIRICKIRNSQLFGMSSPLALIHTEASESDEIVCKLDRVSHERYIGVRFLQDDSELSAVNDCEMYLERYELPQQRPYNEYWPEGNNIGCEEKLNMLARGLQKGNEELMENGGRDWSVGDKTLFGMSLVLLGHYVAGIYWLQVSAAIGDTAAQKSLARALTYQAYENDNQEQLIHASKMMSSINDDEVRLLLALKHSIDSCDREKYDQKKINRLMNQVTATSCAHHNVLKGMILYFRGSYADAVTVLYPHALNGHYSGVKFYCKSAVRFIKTGVNSKPVCRDINNLAQTIGTSISDVRYTRSHCSMFVITGMPDFIISLARGNDDALRAAMEYTCYRALPLLAVTLVSMIPRFMRDRLTGALFVLLGRAKAYWKAY